MNCPVCKADIEIAAIDICPADPASGSIEVFFDCEACGNLSTATLTPEMFIKVDEEVANADA
jgi:hypothetical protein